MKRILQLAILFLAATVAFPQSSPAEESKVKQEKKEEKKKDAKKKSEKDKKGEIQESETSGSVTLEEVTVTGTREEQLKSETPSSIGVVKEDEIRATRPGHPAEVMGRIAGVHVNVTGGEGHATSIRHPMTTAPVYLFLEDGIPTRSTGFFNHNALYEVNIPQAGGIEVTKGPGTSLYGSDAIGGVVNVMTRAAPLTPEFDATLETGEYGWFRAMGSAGGTKGADGVRADFNITRTDGWRDTTEYKRQSSTLRWDHVYDSGAALKTVLAFSEIDQQTAGTSVISTQDYHNNPTANYTPISLRKVTAVRLSSAYEKESSNSLISLTPFVRYNDMRLIPNWSLSYEPQDYTTMNKSLGLLAKYRRDFEPWRTRLIVGVDVDYSPGQFQEHLITPVSSGKYYVDYTTGARQYDYDVDFMGVSPYLHAEASPTERLHLSAGLRYDHLGYDYDNHLSVVTTGTKRRPADTSVTYDHASPKVGATYDFIPTLLNGFISYRHAFRVPSEGQLFRQGQAVSTVDLSPIKANSYEAGIRGVLFQRLSYEINGYTMTKRDDVVSYQNTVDGTRETMNAGKTLHRGAEFAVGLEILRELRADFSYSYAKHTYKEWSPKTGMTYNGNEIAAAPREIGNFRLNYKPALLNGGGMEFEWERLGSYWMDNENTHKYNGHDLFNVRGSYLFDNGFEFYGRIMNLTDERYATLSSYSQFRGEELAPGLPLTVYGGVTYRFN